ncbi:hypothetical protein [Pleionea sediminis]|uniref:hypothetical protein n=1 Tax=Pleionea sediminis TaxID=2569479 RepID=UPI001184B0FA|nr:hypothetical protein [Pleionea sediminis]
MKFTYWLVVTLLSLSTAVNAIALQTKTTTIAAKTYKDKATIVYIQENKYFLEWLNKGKSRRVLLTERPTGIIFDNLGQFVVIGFNREPKKIKIFSFDKPEKTLLAELKNAHFAPLNNRRLIIEAVQKGALKLSTIDLEKNKIIESNTFSTSHPAKLSYQGDIIYTWNFADSVQKTSTIDYLNFSDINERKTISVKENPIHDLAFYNKDYYILSVNDTLKLFKDKKLKWTKKAGDSRVNFNRVAISENQNWILGHDTRNGIFYVFNKNGQATLTWDPFSINSRKLRFLEYEYDFASQSPIYPEAPPKYQLKFVKENELLINMVDKNKAFLINLEDKSSDVMIIKSSPDSSHTNYKDGWKLIFMKGSYEIVKLKTEPYQYPVKRTE